MGFDGGTEIIGGLIKFSRARLGVNPDDPPPPCYYDFAQTDMPEISAAARHFDVVLVDVSFQLFKLMNKAVFGSDLLANLQTMVNEDATLLGTTHHIFSLDIKPLVWSAKRVEQQRREAVAEKAAAAKLAAASSSSYSFGGAGYGSTVILCPTRVGGSDGARISVAAYVFGLNTALPHSAQMMKATPELFAKFCVFISDLIANHVRRPHPAREHTITMSGFVRSTAHKPVAYRQIRTVFLETVVLDELEQRVLLATRDADDDAPPPPLAGPPAPPPSATEAPKQLDTRYAKEQEARATHVESEQLTQEETNAPPIGEAEAQIIYFVETLARASSSPLSFMIRSEDTDCIALALLTVPNLLRAGEQMIAHRLWLDLTHQGTKRLLDVVELWRALMAAETRLARLRSNKQTVAHLIEWIVLLLNLNGNDYCERMSHVTHKLLFDNAEHLLGLVAGCNTPPLMFCDETHDMAVREMLLAQFVLYCLETKPQVAKVLRSQRLHITTNSNAAKMNYEQVVRAKFTYLAEKFSRQTGAGASALVVSPFNEVEAHVRRAVACLHYQRNVTRPDYELLDAYMLGPDRLPLYGYRQWEQTSLSARHGYPPPKKMVYEMSRHVTPHTVVRHPFIRRRRLVVPDPSPVFMTSSSSSTTMVEPEPAAAPVMVPKSTFDKKRKELARDEVESIDDDEDDDVLVISSGVVPAPVVLFEEATKRARTLTGSVDDLDPWLTTANGVIRRPVDPNSGEFGSFLSIVNGGAANASNINNKVKAHSR